MLVFPWESHTIFCSGMVLAHWIQLLIFQLWFYSETYSCTLGSGSFGFSCIDRFFCNMFQSSFRNFLLNWYLGIGHSFWTVIWESVIASSFSSRGLVQKSEHGQGGPLIVQSSIMQNSRRVTPPKGLFKWTCIPLNPWTEGLVWME